eukprot:3282769-Prymnesium_polylepis.2
MAARARTSGGLVGPRGEQQRPQPGLVGPAAAHPPPQGEHRSRPRAAPPQHDACMCAHTRWGAQREKGRGSVHVDVPHLH